jgi:hypothetical protein
MIFWVGIYFWLYSNTLLLDFVGLKLKSPSTQLGWAGEAGLISPIS